MFWNVGAKNDVSDLVARACREHEVDILVLAEFGRPLSELLEGVNAGADRPLTVPFNPSTRLTILARYSPDALRPVQDLNGVAVRHLQPPVGADILVVGVHLPSQMFYGVDDLALYATEVSRVVAEAEAAVGHTRTIVVGDFNMNPFDLGIAGSHGLHAVSNRVVASRGSRKIQNTVHEFFYNPMWARLGDRPTGPPGTYYRADSKPFTLFWHAFDQVLIRPALLDRFSDDDLLVLTDIDGVSLTKSGFVPDTDSASDHLPLVFKIDIERLL